MRRMPVLNALDAKRYYFYDYGWYDRHHAGGPGCYHDNLYWGKDNYHRFSVS